MRRMICALAVGLCRGRGGGRARTVRRSGRRLPGQGDRRVRPRRHPGQERQGRDVEEVRGPKLSARGAHGKATDYKWEKAEHRFKAAAPAGSRVVFGQADAGVTTRAGEADARPVLPEGGRRRRPRGRREDGRGVPARAGGGGREGAVPGARRRQAGGRGDGGGDRPGEHGGGRGDDGRGDGLTPAFEGVGRFLARGPAGGGGGRRVERPEYEQATHVATLVVGM